MTTDFLKYENFDASHYFQNGPCTSTCTFVCTVYQIQLSTVYEKRGVQLIVDDAGQVVLEKQTTCGAGIDAHAKMSRLNNPCEDELREQ